MRFVPGPPRTRRHPAAYPRRRCSRSRMSRRAPSQAPPWVQRRDRGKDCHPPSPPLEILKEPSNAWQQEVISSAAIQSTGASKASNSAKVQVAATCSAVSVRRKLSQRSAERSTRRRKAGCGSEKSQVPPARKLSPLADGGSSDRMRGRRTASTVFRSIAVSQ